MLAHIKEQHHIDPVPSVEAEHIRKGLPYPPVFRNCKATSIRALLPGFVARLLARAGKLSR
jgi:hypothetical protein